MNKTDEKIWILKVFLPIDKYSIRAKTNSIKKILLTIKDLSLRYTLRNR